MDGNDCSWDVLFGCGLTNAWVYYRISHPKTTRYDFLVAVQEGLLKADEVAEARKEKKIEHSGKRERLRKAGENSEKRTGIHVCTNRLCCENNRCMC